MASSINHVALNVNPVDDLDRPFDSAFNSLTKYNIAGFAYQGVYTPRPWAQTTLGYNFEDENGYINNNSDARYHHDPRPALQQLPVRATDHRVAAAVGAWREWATSTTAASEAKSARALRQRFWRGVATQFFSGTRLHFGYAEGIKEPSFEQTFGITGTFPTLPNPNLKPEQNQAIEAGVLQSLFNNRVVAQRRVLPQSVPRPDRIRVQLRHQH